jgi:hypothetical protein
MSAWYLSDPVKKKLVEMTASDRRTFVLDFSIPAEYVPQPDPAGEWLISIDRQCGLRGIADSEIRGWLSAPPRSFRMEEDEGSVSGSQSSKSSGKSDPESARILAQVEKNSAETMQTISTIQQALSDLPARVAADVIARLGPLASRCGIATNLPWEVFFCYNSKDDYFVTAIRNQLTKRRLRVWQDTEGILPGEKFTEKIESALRNSGAAAIFIGEYGLGSYQNQEVEVISSLFENLDRPIIPCMLPNCSEDSIQQLISSAPSTKGRCRMDFTNFADLLSASDSAQLGARVKLNDLLDLFIAAVRNSGVPFQL